MTKTGMILGKFLPPHRGHTYLVNFARNYVDDLVVVVGTLKNESIPGELRHRWMAELFPDIHVAHLTDENPQHPNEHPDFWNIWRESLKAVLPWKLNVVFASEAYGVRLARELDAEYVPVDPSREIMPVSGTAIRTDPWRHWQFLPDPVRAHYAIRVCVFGPESTGKSILAMKLAQRYQTVFVPEYARTLLELKRGELTQADIPRIARGQISSEDALARNCNRVLFCDTDVLATKIWSETLYGSCPNWIADEADKRICDLYLVTDVDVPWVKDSVRYLPNDRRTFLDSCVRALEGRGRRYVQLSGNWDQRLERAYSAVDQLLREHTDQTVSETK